MIRGDLVFQGNLKKLFENKDQVKQFLMNFQVICLE